MLTVKFVNPRIGDMNTVVLGCLSGIAFPIGFAYITDRLGAFGGITKKFCFKFPCY